MSFSRTKYDDGAYQQSVDRSVYGLNYNFDISANRNCNRCFAPYGVTGGYQGADAVGREVDVESALCVLDRMLSQDNQDNIPADIEVPTFMPNNCPPSLAPESSRYLNPPSEFKGVGDLALQLDYPLTDPQCNIFDNFS